MSAMIVLFVPLGVKVHQSGSLKGAAHYPQSEPRTVADSSQMQTKERSR